MSALNILVLHFESIIVDNQSKIIFKSGIKILFVFKIIIDKQILRHLHTFDLSLERTICSNNLKFEKRRGALERMYTIRTAGLLKGGCYFLCISFLTYWLWVCCVTGTSFPVDLASSHDALWSCSSSTPPQVSLLPRQPLSHQSLRSQGRWRI